MPEILDFAVAANQDGGLEILAVVASSAGDLPGGGAVWRARELPVPGGGEPQWALAWQSLGRPPGETWPNAVTMARNHDGRLEAAILTPYPGGQVYHAWQDRPDGNWSGWQSLGSPVPFEGTTGPALAANSDGRLEVFVVSEGENPVALWHRGQQEPGHNQWTDWSPLGYPADDSGQYWAPTVGQNKDGRLEVHLITDDTVWHTWQIAANSPHWVPWARFDPQGLVPSELESAERPWLVRDHQGRLRVFMIDRVTRAVWGRSQPAPGRGPWSPWSLLRPEADTGIEAANLAVAAQKDGRLIMFVLRYRSQDGTASLERLEEASSGTGEWTSADVIEDVPVNPSALVMTLDSGGRLRLFFNFPQGSDIYYLEQASPSSSQWQQKTLSFQAPAP